MALVAPVPYRVTGAEVTLKGKIIDDELAAKAAEVATQETVLLKDNKYKMQIAKALIKRAILAARTSL